MGKQRQSNKALSYARVSSQSKKDRGGFKRQSKAISSFAKGNLIKVMGGISEVVSGSMPAHRRQGFRSLMAQAVRRSIDTVLVETASRVARELHANEELYQESKKLGVTIKCADAPYLYKHDPNPMDIFCRRLVVAYGELEKDMLVGRLQEGLKTRLAKRTAEWRAKRKAAKKTLRGLQGRRLAKPSTASQYLTQVGNVKARGRGTLLSHMRITNTQVKRFKAACKSYDRGNVSARQLGKLLFGTMPWRTYTGKGKKPRSFGPGQALRIKATIAQRWP